jgi:hypothetical protein
VLNTYTVLGSDPAKSPVQPTSESKMTTLQCNALKDPSTARLIRHKTEETLRKANNDWGSVLSAGPSALVCLAQCVLVANWHESASLIELQRTGEMR